MNGYLMVRKVLRILDPRGLFYDRRTPRLVCVSHDAIFHGAQLLVLHIGQVLKEKFGFEVTTVLLGGGPLRSQFAGVGRVVDFSDPPWNASPNRAVQNARRRIVRQLYRQGARHVICNTTVSGSIVRLFKEEGFRVVVLIHELPKLIREFELEPLIKEISWFADCVIFPAEFVRAGFMPLSDLDRERTVIRPQGLYRANLYRNSKEQARAELRTMLGLDGEAAIVFAAGPCDKRKGVDIFCEVAAEVIRMMPGVHFVWAGEDRTDLGSHFKEWINSVGLESNVHFTGVLKEARIYSLYMAGADLFLIPSREDPFPSVVLDAMEAGIPVLGFENAGGFTGLLEQGAGLLVPYENVAAMAHGVTNLLSDVGRMKIMGDRGQKLIEENFDFTDYVRDLLRSLRFPTSRFLNRALGE